jgi:ketosteroid isomerase-like protein
MQTLIARLIPPIVALLILADTARSQHSTTDSITQRVISHLADDWVSAYNDEDTAALGSFYTEDAQYISPHVAGYILYGRKEIVDNFMKGARGGGHIDSIRVLSCTVTDQMASVVCRYHATNGGVEVNGRNVIVLRNVNGRWLYAIHASIIRD